MDLFLSAGSAWTGQVRPTVLVVDDQATNRLLVRGCLEPYHRVLEADSGDAALAILERETVDVVLLDVLMPGRNGYDTCAEIKLRHQNVLLPVVMLSALSDQDSRNEGLRVGADDFLCKPIDRRELQLRVHGMIRLRHQQEQIDRQVRELRSMQELKDDLVSLILHDLRTPLAALMGLLDLMCQDMAPAVGIVPQDLIEAQQCAKRLNELVDEVLTVSNLEEQRFPVARIAHDPGDIVAEAIATLAPAARLADVPLVLVREQVPHVAVDAALLRRAVENLVANALRYATPGTGVEIHVRNQTGGVTIEVADRGPGVPDASKSMIFGKFSSTELRRTRGRRGFGLGLYLVHLVAQAHEGHVGVEDRPGGGSIFRLVLPLAPDCRQVEG